MAAGRSKCVEICSREVFLECLLIVEQEPVTQSDHHASIYFVYLCSHSYSSFPYCCCLKTMYQRIYMVCVVYYMMVRLLLKTVSIATNMSLRIRHVVEVLRIVALVQWVFSVQQLSPALSCSTRPAAQLLVERRLQQSKSPVCALLHALQYEPITERLCNRQRKCCIPAYLTDRWQYWHMWSSCSQ